MAAAQLNFDESTLDHSTGLYDLYSRFYEGMRTANTADAPDFSTNPPLTPEGAIDNASIATQLAAYSDILMKNSAYMMANAIMSTVSGGGSGGTAGVGFLSRNGDMMVGKLGALYGFEAGAGNTKIFDVYFQPVEGVKKPYAHVYGSLIVDDIVTGGTIEVQGISIDGQKAVYIDNSGALVLEKSRIRLQGDVYGTGSITLDTLVISSNGIKIGDNWFYHQGNSNNSTTDWAMKDGHVYGNLTVNGTIVGSASVDFLHGFQFGEFGNRMFYSVKDQGDDQAQIVHINLASDIHIADGNALRFLSKAIVKVQHGNESVVSFSAPGMVLNLGDSDGATKTTRISLQSDIWNYSSDYRIVSANGDGNFPNSLSVGCANSGPTVLQTYYESATDCGVVFQRKIRFGSAGGPAIYKNDSGDILTISLPYQSVVNEVPVTQNYGLNMEYIQTTSLFRNQSLGSSVTLRFTTDGEFFQFAKPVEVSSLSIISERYKTRLIENALMFGDSIFLEGVVDGILHQGNAYFSGNLSSIRFASGFAGYGWAINESELYGGIAATFDELTVRKKMRIYELEVQKISVTNGSLWVSDACSGDIVEEII